MNLISTAKSILKNISNGNIDAALKQLGRRSMLQFKRNDFRSRWKNVSGSNTDYEKQYEFFKDLNDFVFDLKEKDILYWIKRGAIGLATIIVGALITMQVETCVNKVTEEKCEIDDCTVVVTNFAGELGDHFPELIRNALLKHQDHFNTTICLTEDGTKLVENELEDNLLGLIDGVPQLIISGWYNDEKNVILELFTPPDTISREFELNRNNKFKLGETDPYLLEEKLEETGLELIILSSFANASACPNFMQFVNDQRNEDINKVSDANTRSLIHSLYAEFNYAEENLQESENSINRAINADSRQINNYAIRARIMQTLGRVPQAFGDYSHFLKKFRITNNPIISNHKVRASRCKMLEEAYYSTGDRIFDQRMTKQEVIRSLNEDINFYNTTRLKGVNRNEIILRTQKLIEAIENGTAPDLKIVVGKVLNHDLVGISNVYVDLVNYPYNTVSDKDGNFNLEVSNLNSWIEFSKAGYKTKMVEAIDVLNNITVRMDLEEEEVLAPQQTTTLYGTVFGENQKPLDGARLSIGGKTVGITNEEGEYYIKSDESNGKIVASHDAYLSQPKSYNGDGTIIFYLEEEPLDKYRVSGYVYSQLEKPLSGVQISIPTTTIKTSTDVNGQFQLESNQSIASLKAKLKGYKTKAVSLNGSNFVEVILQKEDHIISGTIKDLNNKILPGAKISILENQNSTTSNKYGNYKINAGTHPKIMTIEMQGYDAQHVEIKQRTKIDVVLKKSATSKKVTGKVIDVQQKGIANAKVIGKGVNVGTVTNFDGSFTINIPIEVSNLVVSHPAFNPTEKFIETQNNLIVTLSSSSLDHLMLVCGNKYYSNNFSLDAKMLQFNTQKDLNVYLEALNSGEEFDYPMVAYNVPEGRPRKTYYFTRNGKTLTSKDQFDFKQLVNDNYHYLVVYIENEEHISFIGKSLIIKTNYTGKYTVGN